MAVVGPGSEANAATTRSPTRVRLWPLARQAVRSFRLAYVEERRSARVALIAALLLGVVPVLKSAMEAAFLSCFADFARGARTGDSDIAALLRFDQYNLPAIADLFPVGDERPVGTTTVVVGLALYAAVVAIAWTVQVASARASSRVTRSYFVQLQLLGWRAALEADPAQEARLRSLMREGDEGRETGGDEGHRLDDGASGSGFWSKAVQDGASSVANVTTQLFDVFQGLVTFVVAALVVRNLGWRVLLAFVAVLVLAVGLAVAQARRLRSQRERHERQRARLNSRTADVLENRDVVRAWEQVEVAETRLEGYARSFADCDAELDVAATRYREATNSLFNGGRIFVVFVFAAYVGATTESVYDVFFVSTLYFRLLEPLMTVVRTMNSWAEASAKTKMFGELVNGGDGEPDVVVASTDPIEPTTDALLSFEQVTFTYPDDDEPTLSGLTFEIPRGKTTLIVGRSGIGKSTIVRMMMGFLAPDDGGGIVRLDGTDLRSMSNVDLLNRVDYLAQAHHTVFGTVRDNLFADPDTGDEELRRRLDLVQLDRVGLDDDASGLSYGQRQRLSFARLFNESGADLAILDEPVAGIDGFTMAKLFDVLRHELDTRGRTVGIIIHRLVFARIVDHVLTLTDGPADEPVRIEAGAPAALLGTDSAFDRMYGFARAELDGVLPESGPGASAASSMAG